MRRGNLQKAANCQKLSAETISIAAIGTALAWRRQSHKPGCGRGGENLLELAQQLFVCFVDRLAAAPTDYKPPSFTGPFQESGAALSCKMPRAAHGGSDAL